VSGAWALAGTICVTGWAFSAIAAVACQLGRQVGQARGLSMLVLALAFTMRVSADQISDGTDSDWLRWLTPLGWRDLVRPYTDDRFGVLAVCCTVAIAVMLSAAVLAARREYLDGYLPDRSSSRRRWRVRGHMDLLGRLSWRSLIGWALASTALALLYGSVSGSIKDLLAPGSPPPEREIGPVLDQVFGEATGQIVVASFASHVHRVQQVINAAAHHGRRVAFVGRSMERNISRVKALIYL